MKDNCFTLHKDVAWEDLSFKTPSKKYELFSSLAKDECGHPLPTYLKSKNHPKNLLRLITVHAKDSLSSQHFIDKGGICEFFINENTCKEFNITNKVCDEILALPVYPELKEENIKTFKEMEKDYGCHTVSVYP